MSAPTNRRAAKRFRAGDLVTWGSGALTYRVVRVVADGVHCDGVHCDGPEFFRFCWTVYGTTYTLRHVTAAAPSGRPAPAPRPGRKSAKQA